MMNFIVLYQCSVFVFQRDLFTGSWVWAPGAHPRRRKAAFIIHDNKASKCESSGSKTRIWAALSSAFWVCCPSHPSPLNIPLPSSHLQQAFQSATSTRSISRLWHGRCFPSRAVPGPRLDMDTASYRRGEGCTCMGDMVVSDHEHDSNLEWCGWKGAGRQKGSCLEHGDHTFAPSQPRGSDRRDSSYFE